MKIIGREKRMCACCMEEHEVMTVLVKDQTIFKGVKVSYEAEYQYCDKSQELFMDEKQVRENDIRIKDAYRKSEGLLTSEHIIDIREKYGVSQKDLCVLLGWGGKTITRYETHQVQDKAHDTILKKLDSDPEWFMSLLIEAKPLLPVGAYQKYLEKTTWLYEKNKDFYLRKSIEASYVRFQGEQELHGNTKLSLDKVIDVIRYFAASRDVTNLYKVKLMKLMWYADAFAYKTRGKAITGLVYQALPMGAVPVAHDSIINLNHVPCEEVDMGETIAYYFSEKGEPAYPNLSDEEIEILDCIIAKLGHMSKKEIVEYMHEEQAYKKTAAKDFISFTLTESLQI